MKKTVSFLLILTMVFLSIFSVSLSAYADYKIPSYVRIGLFYGGNSKNSVTVSSDEGLCFGHYNGTDFKEEKRTSLTDVTVSFTSNGIVVESNGVNVFSTSDKDEGLGVFPAKGGLKRVLSIDGDKYRGGLDFKTVNGNNVIANVVFLDNYLYGVISKEMSPSWHQEALKAQAVCARNFAIQNLNKHKKYGFDLCNSVCCQAYLGTKYETDNSYAPVDETSNQILTYKGELAELYYSASAGPRTENITNVWGDSIPYLIGVDNSFEDTANIPNGVWSGSITCEEATTIMRNKGYNIGDVKDIRVTETSESGRVTKMEVVGTGGTKVFEREGCRSIFNTITKSQLFTVRGNGSSAQNAPTVTTTDGNSVANKKISELVLLTSDGRYVMIDVTKLFATNGVYQQSYEVTQSDAKNNTGFIFEGKGWGHAVGMSQYGAKGMAEAGYDYVSILLHYFPGTNLENAY